MKQLIHDFPLQLREALQLLEKADFGNILTQPAFSNIVIAGLGGSGISGKIAKNLLEPFCTVPIANVYTYDIPAFVGENTLFITCSYSGNTEETLSAFEQALQQKAKIFVITSGGLLAEKAKANHIPYLLIPSGRPPRASFGYALVNIMGLLEKLGLCGKNNYTAQIPKLAQFLEKEMPNMQEDAKKVANFILGKIPVVYTQELNEGVAIRFRQQFTENAKMLGWHHVIPEMNHNEIVGWQEPQSNLAVLFLYAGNENEREKIRFDVMQEITSQHADKNITQYHLHGKGSTWLEKYFYLVLTLDWASVYLAELRNQDPTPVKNVDYLKKRLSQG